MTYFTSESVTCGHPDKVCDRIADRILDEILKRDAKAHVACEVTVSPQKVHIMGEITAKAKVNYKKIARQTIKDIGYTKSGQGFDCDTCNIIVDIHEQSPDIAIGIERKDMLDSGAGDQGMMFGYACKETFNLMPISIETAHMLAKRIDDVRIANILPYLLPDGKTQVTFAYENGLPKKISTIIISAQHTEDISIDKLRDDIERYCIRQVLPEKLIDHDTMVFINPTGRFTIGGPAGDTGLTGRKIIVDTYGGYSRHGGGSFSGKDPTKVDRSGAYMARYIAKNIVAADLADRCEVQLGYSIGFADPISVFLETFGTEKVPVKQLYDFIKDIDLRPAAIIERFNLRRAIYTPLSCYGSFGENAKKMPWEQTDLAENMAV